MSDFDPGGRNYECEYDDYDEHPLAKLYRHEWEEHERRHKLIDRFLATLGPEDAQLDLFTHDQRAFFNITAHRKRPRA